MSTRQVLFCFAMPNLDVSGLPPLQRAARYRQLAEEMHSLADLAISDDSKKGYLRMATEWLELAHHLEAEHNRVTVTVQAPELAALLSRKA